MSHLNVIFIPTRSFLTVTWADTESRRSMERRADALAITDHIEYQPHKKYIPADQNAAWKIAKDVADRL